jgi:hypothetical protein
MSLKTSEDNLSFLSGVLAFLVLSTYFISIVIFGRPGDAGLFIVAGIVILSCLVIIHLKNKFPVTKIVVAIGAGMVLSLIVLVATVLIGVSLIGSVNPPPPAGASPVPLEYNRSITLDVPLPAFPATVPEYRIVSVQKFSTGTGTALRVKDRIPSVSEAPGLAEQALEKYGGLPADAVIERTEQVFLKKYNLETETVEEQYPQYTRVSYRQYVNGSPVMSSGISVSLGENGEPLDISKEWCSLEYAGEVPVISAEEGFEKLRAGDLLIPLQCCLDRYRIVRVQFGYNAETHLPDASMQAPAPNRFTPVWIFYGIKQGTDTGPFPLMVNATRG